MIFRYAPLSAPYSFWWSGWRFIRLSMPHGQYSYLAELHCCEVR